LARSATSHSLMPDQKQNTVSRSWGFIHCTSFSL
jgi:hypothetical protein